MPDLTFKVNVKIPGLKKGAGILREELGKAGPIIGVHVRDAVRGKQRIDTGEERRRTIYRVEQKTSLLTINVFNTVVQALVDETGAKWSDRMPPYKEGSKLFAWVVRKGIARTFSGRERKFIAGFHRTDALRAGASKEQAKQAGRAGLKDALDEQNRLVEQTTFLIARSIQRRGLPRPGDALRKPFETTRKEERPYIFATVNGAVEAAVNRINTEG